MLNNFWKNKKVFITGHTGFKGSWLTLILSQMGAKVVGYSLNPISKPSFFDDCKLKKYLIKDVRSNILNYNKLKKCVSDFKPDIFIHLAAQSSVLESYKTPRETLETNISGTSNILHILKDSKSVKSAIIVTTDKVYLNLEKKKKFNELDSLGGYDIYSGSKAACEIISHSYIKSFFKNSNCNIATVRSGNCIGGGDWTKDRIVKDCAELFIFNKNLTIRSPRASRPWQHVLEPLFGYLNLAQKLYKSKKYIGAWNFGPNVQNNMNVLDVAKFAKKILNSKSSIKVKKQKYYESEHLALDSSKSNNNLKWKTHMNAKTALKISLDWYYFFYKKNKKKIVDFTFDQITEYKKKFINVKK
jgi:CDP-glucose 4,6-dehydratase